MTNLEQHMELLCELHHLYEKKNHDYGDSFHQTFLEEGFTMSRIRLTDKLMRFKRLSLSGEQNVHDESIRDTLMDLANYALMTVMEIDQYQKEADDSLNEIEKDSKLIKPLNAVLSAKLIQDMIRPCYSNDPKFIGCLGQTDCQKEDK